MHWKLFNSFIAAAVTFTMTFGYGPLSFSGKLIAGITHSLFTRFKLPGTCGNSMVESCWRTMSEFFCLNQDAGIRMSGQILTCNLIKQVWDYNMTSKLTSRVLFLGFSLLEQLFLLLMQRDWIPAAAKHWGTLDIRQL